MLGNEANSIEYDRSRVWIPKGRLDGSTNCTGRCLPQNSRKPSPGVWTKAAALDSAHSLHNVTKGKILLTVLMHKILPNVKTESEVPSLLWPVKYYCLIVCNALVDQSSFH